jgi:peptidoglycan/xylan/chitin deacetylase (PgdA/CDA1 family)/PKD repeat protein
MKTRLLLTSLVLAALLAASPAPAQTLQPWPGVTFTFDDGYQSLGIVRPLFKQFGMVATAFPIVTAIGTPGMATWEDLQGLVADGWEIGSHTMTHVNLVNCTDSQLIYEVAGSVITLQDHLNTDVYALAFPYGAGANDPRVMAAVKDYYYFARNTYPWVYNPVPPSPFGLTCYEAFSDTTPQTVIQWIEDAKSHNGWIMIDLHNIVNGTANPGDAYSYGTDQLTQILQYIKDNGYPTPTVTAAFRQFLPVANAGPNRVVPPLATVTLDGSASSDPCGQVPLGFVWSFKSKPAGSHATLSDDVANVTPSFTLDVRGSYEVQLEVVNQIGVFSQPTTVTITTDPLINAPPVANAGPAQTVHPGATVTLDGSNSSDSEGDAFTWAWSFASKPDGSNATLSDPNIVNPTFMVDKTGSYVVQLIVTDSLGAASTPTNVTISTSNSAPVANAGSPISVHPGTAVTLDGSKSSDPDFDPITYAWGFTSIPAGSTAVLNDSTLAKPGFTPDQIGTYAVQLIVTDSFGAASTPATVTINAINSAPVANAGPAQTVHQGTTVTLNGSQSFDPEGDAITWAWSFTSRPTGSTAILNNVNSVTPSFTADKSGSYVVKLIVTDSYGAVSSPVSVTITAGTSLPVANAGPNQNVAIGATVQLNGSASYSPYGGPLTYAWSLSSRPRGSVAALANPTTVNPTFVADKSGSYTVQLVVKDSWNAASRADAVIVRAR